MALFVFKMIKPQIQAMLRIYFKQVFQSRIHSFIGGKNWRQKGKWLWKFVCSLILHWFFKSCDEHHLTSKGWFGIILERLSPSERERHGVVNQWKWLDCEVANTYVRPISWEILKLRIGNNLQKTDLVIFCTEHSSAFKDLTPFQNWPRYFEEK